MRNLQRRVERLEGPYSGKFSVWAQVPREWTEEHQREQATAMALEQGVKEPFTLTLFPNRELHEGVKLLYAGGTDQLIEALRSIVCVRPPPP